MINGFAELMYNCRKLISWKEFATSNGVWANQDSAAEKCLRSPENSGLVAHVVRAICNG